MPSKLYDTYNYPVLATACFIGLLTCLVRSEPLLDLRSASVIRVV